jgi:glycosyltransferase involved in cell wall biosynthesis
MRIAILTDAWLPQTNGVVRTLVATAETARKLGHDVRIVAPGDFRTFACPTYREIRLAWFPSRRLDSLLREFSPEALHIATEGTLGHAGRRWCRANGMPFTSSYQTQFPEYLRARLSLGLEASYAYLRRFHGAAERTLVATPSMRQRLELRGFRNIVPWTRGVDVDLFRPGRKDLWPHPRPISLYFGRLAVEKNVEAFLSLDLPGTQVVIGDGPGRAALQRKYPRAVFTGYKFDQDLARHVAAADVFVFPSRTDTFGLVLLEAMACGVPVAAYPVTGPVDVVLPGVTGALDEDLGAAVRAALRLDPRQCRAWACQHSWEAATQQFLSQLAPAAAVGPAGGPAAAPLLGLRTAPA